jgi:predicted MFS family arabinose efflux permease
VRFFGRNAPGLGAALLCSAVSIFAWKYLGESRNASLAAGAAQRSSLSAIWHVLSRPRQPAARLIWIYSIAVGAFYGTIPTMPLVLSKRLAVDEQTVGFIIMYRGGVGVVVRVWILGRMADWLGEARLARAGLGLLGIGLALVGAINSYFVMFIACTIMPIGTAFVFPAVTAALSRVVAAGERGLYMGVQHTFGGVSRVAFPLAAGATMDRFGVGIPFYVAGALVGATLFLTLQMEAFTEPPVPNAKSTVAAGV